MDKETEKINEKYANIEDFNSLIAERLRKLEKLKELEIEPYPYTFKKSVMNIKLKEKYAKLEKEETTEDNFIVAGRITAMRKMGKASFVVIDDGTAKLQLYLRQDNVGKENYDHFLLLFLKLFFFPFTRFR